MKIKTYQSFHSINENKSSIIEVYHGDNFQTSSIEIKNMDLGGNMQEGVGIYFSTKLSVAQEYGDKIIKATINDNNFLPSQDSVEEWLKVKTIYEILKDLSEDSEAMFYLVSDYGIYIEEPEDLEKGHLKELAEQMKTEEVRNFQITLAQSFGVKNFVNSWLSNTDYQGTKNEDLEFYCIIDPTIEVTKMK